MMNKNFKYELYREISIKTIFRNVDGEGPRIVFKSQGRGAEIKLLLVSPGGASMVRTTAKSFIF